MSPYRTKAALTLAAGHLVLVWLPLLGVWHAAGTAYAAVATPSQAVDRLVALLAEPAFVNDIAWTLRTVLYSTAIGAVIGAIAGISIGSNRRANQATMPTIIALAATPRVILYPALLLILGLGFWPQLAIGVLGALFPMLLVTAAAARAIPRTWRDVAAACQTNSLQLLGKILIPAILPSFTYGLRLSYSIALVNVLLAEMFNSPAGLGQRFLNATQMFAVLDVYAIVLSLLGLALIGNLLLYSIEKWARAGTAIGSATDGATAPT